MFMAQIKHWIAVRFQVFFEARALSAKVAAGFAWRALQHKDESIFEAEIRQGFPGKCSGEEST
jgi:hypothetical protein